jgi:hypothetical protein
VEPTAAASKVITALAARVVDGMNAIAARG